jgi:hypothetical protein
VGETFPEIEVIATDGADTKRILWLNRTPNGLYAGWSFAGVGAHFSYHKDGRTHWDFGGRKVPYKERAPLNAVKGLNFLLVFGIPRQLMEATTSYGRRKRDIILHIDTRSFRKRMIVCHLLLLEPGRFDHLNCIMQKTGLAFNYSIINVITQVEPWVVVAFYDTQSEAFEDLKKDEDRLEQLLEPSHNPAESPLDRT